MTTTVAFDETLPNGFIPGYRDIDNVILAHVSRLFTLGQLASVNTYFNTLIKAFRPTGVAAPSHFIWFIGAVETGTTTAVREYLDKFPKHASEPFQLRDYPEWTRKPKTNLFANAFYIARHSEDTLLALAEYRPLRFSHEHSTMPRLVAKHASESNQVYSIVHAFRESNMDFLQKINELIPEINTSVELRNKIQNKIQDCVLNAIERGNAVLVLWAVEHGWMRAERVHRTLIWYGHNELAETILAKYM